MTQKDKAETTVHVATRVPRAVEARLLQAGARLQRATPAGIRLRPSDVLRAVVLAGLDAMEQDVPIAVKVQA